MSKVAVVTGASKGIGASVAVAFAKAGYDIVLNYRSDTNSAQRVANSIESLGQKALLVQADAFLEEGVEELFKQVKNKFEKIDVLVNNAGDPNEPGFGEITCKDLNRSLGANFGATVLCTQEAIRLMGKGSILFTSSIYGLNFGGSPNLPLYSAGKAAMINFMQTMAEKLAPNIRCNAVAPGTTKTPAWEGVSDEYVAKSLDMTLQKEWVDADEIAAAFVFLAETPHINGQTLVVDGGWQKKIRDTKVKRR